MDRELSSPDFNAARARSNSSSRVPDYYFYVTSSHCHRNVDTIFAHLPQLHPIPTTHEVPCTSATVHAVPSPTTDCNSPQTNDDTQSAISKIAGALGSFGFDFQIRRRKAPQNAIQPMMHGGITDAVPQPVPIPTQTSLLMPAVPVDNAVANTPDQCLAQPLPPATTAAANPPPPPLSARPEWDPDDRDLLLKSANRPRFTELSGVRIFEHFWRTPRTSSICEGARATAGLVSSYRGFAQTKPRKYVVLIFLVTT